MFIIINQGGLGNQLFQYAFAKQLQKHTQRKVILGSTVTFKKDTLGRIDILPELNTTIPSTKGFQQFSTNMMFRMHRSLAKKRNPAPQPFRNFTFKYESDLPPPYDSAFFEKLGACQIPGKIALAGYWQDAAITNPNKEELLQEFQYQSSIPKTIGMTDDISKWEAMIRESITQETNEPVAIHFRQNFKGDGPLKAGYYEHAIGLIAEKTQNPFFYVFADDNNKAKEILQGCLAQDKYLLFPHYKDARQAYQTILLMSKCQHFVMSNSTFCWWATWMSWAKNPDADNYYVMPSKGFGDPFSFSDKCLIIHSE